MERDQKKKERKKALRTLLLMFFSTKHVHINALSSCGYYYCYCFIINGSTSEYECDF